MKLSMKMLRGCLFAFVFSLFLPPTFAEDEVDWRKERNTVYESAGQALWELEKVLSRIGPESFSNTPTTEQVKIGKTVFPPGSDQGHVLRRQIQFLIAQIDLAQDYPATEFKGPRIINDLLKSKDFFGAAPQDLSAFEEKQALLERLFSDENLLLGNRIFGLMITEKESPKSGVQKWTSFVETIAGPGHFGAPFDRQAAVLGKSLRALAVLKGVSQSSSFQEVLAANPDLKYRFEETMNSKLKPAIVNFAKERYEKGGLLRDWCLPVTSAANHLFPDVNPKAIGVASLAQYQKSSLAHARAVTRLVKRIDESEPSPEAARNALKTIHQYVNQPYYIGSSEVRESGTLRVPAHREIETILGNAQFFGENGNRSLKVYKKRSEHLNGLFQGKAGAEALDLLIALKPRDEWMRFFHENLFGQDQASKQGVFQRIELHHRVSIYDLKILFLARTILPSEAFQKLFKDDPHARKQLDRLLASFGTRVRDTASLEFRNYPKHWINVQNGFLEISKGFPEYSFDQLKVTTSTDLALVRKDFEEGLYGNQSVPEDFLSLLLPNTKSLIPSINQMTSPELNRRAGKFDKQLSPEFVESVNIKLANILEYRGYGLAAIDSLERPDLQPGRIMTPFAVSDYRLPQDRLTNTVIHDLLCGPDGGFGGIGQLFRSDAKGYKERESALDAIATSSELQLGESLFRLALDIKREKQISDEDLGRAARRWIKYFRKSQANAQFHAVPDVLAQAIRGTFLSRVVFQSDSFQKALANSSNAPVGSPADISHELEDAVSAQIRKMQGILQHIDPDTATNRNLDENAGKWRDFKVWYLESTKWLEAVVADPLMIGEIRRIRKLNRKIADYQELCPEVLVFKKALEHSGSEVYSQTDPPTAGLAKFAMDQVTKLEPDLSLPLPDLEATPEDVEKIEQLEFGKAVSNEFLNEIRKIVRVSGFKDLSNATSPEQVGKLHEAAIPNEASLNADNPQTVTNRAKAMEESFKAAVARAISRVEAGQPSDFRKLQGQAIRAAKVDQVLSEKVHPQYRISVAPSMLVTDWINRDRVEIMADFRTVELTSEARQMINKAKQERKALEEVQEELRETQAETLQKMELLQKWMDETGEGGNVEAVMNEVFAMRQEVSDLRREVSNLRDSETLMRARAADLAQQIFHYKQGQIKPKPPEDESDAEKEKEPTKKIEVASATTRSRTVYKKPSSSSRSSSSRSTYRKPASSSSSSRSRPSSSSSRKKSTSTFFQRLFGRKR